MIAVIFAAMVGAGILVANVPVSDEQKLIDENRTSISVSYEKMDGATKITRVVVMPDASIPTDCNQSENSISCNYKWGRESMIRQDSKVIVTTELDVKALDCKTENNIVKCIQRKFLMTKDQFEVEEIMKRVVSSRIIE